MPRTLAVAALSCLLWCDGIAYAQDPSPRAFPEPADARAAIHEYNRLVHDRRGSEAADYLRWARQRIAERQKGR